MIYASRIDGLPPSGAGALELLHQAPQTGTTGAIRGVQRLKGFCIPSPAGARPMQASTDLHRPTLHKDRPPYTRVRAVRAVCEASGKVQGQVVRPTLYRVNRSVMHALGLGRADGC